MEEEESKEPDNPSQYALQGGISLRDWFAGNCSEAEIAMRIPGSIIATTDLLIKLGRIKPSAREHNGPAWERYTEADVLWLRAWARYDYADSMLTARQDKRDG